MTKTCRIKCKHKNKYIYKTHRNKGGDDSLYRSPGLENGGIHTQFDTDIRKASDEEIKGAIGYGFGIGIDGIDGIDGTLSTEPEHITTIKNDIDKKLKTELAAQANTTMLKDDLLIFEKRTLTKLLLKKLKEIIEEKKKELNAKKEAVGVYNVVKKELYELHENPENIQSDSQNGEAASSLSVVETPKTSIVKQKPSSKSLSPRLLTWFTKQTTTLESKPEKQSELDDNYSEYNSKQDKLKLLTAKQKAFEDSSRQYFLEINERIDKLTDQENYIITQLKKAPKKLKESILIATAQNQTKIISDNYRKDGFFTSDETFESGVALVSPASALVGLIGLTAGIIITGVTVTTAVATIVHTGGIALIGLSAFIGTVIYSSIEIDDFMNHIYSLQSSIAKSFNRMRLHFEILNKLLKENSINYRIFCEYVDDTKSNEESACDELIEFLSISMYFYQVFFMYMNNNVANAITKKNDLARQEISDEIKLDNQEYLNQGIEEHVVKKLTGIIKIRKQSITEKTQGILAKIGKGLTTTAKYTYRGLSIKTIKKNLNIVLDILKMAYTNLLSKYTEDYAIALMYLQQHNISVADIDKLFFINTYEQLYETERPFNVEEITSNTLTSLEDTLLTKIISSSLDNPNAATGSITAAPVPVSVSASVPTSAPTDKSLSAPIPALKSETPKSRGFFAYLFGLSGGGLSGLQRNYKNTSFAKNASRVESMYKQKTQKNNGKLLQLKNDFSKIKKLYGRVVFQRSKSKKIKPTNKPRTKTRTKRYCNNYRNR